MTRDRKKPGPPEGRIKTPNPLNFNLTEEKFKAQINSLSQEPFALIDALIKGLKNKLAESMNLLDAKAYPELQQQLGQQYVFFENLFAAYQKVTYLDADQEIAWLAESLTSEQQQQLYRCRGVQTQVKDLFINIKTLHREFTQAHENIQEQTRSIDAKKAASASQKQRQEAEIFYKKLLFWSTLFAILCVAAVFVFLVTGPLAVLAISSVTLYGSLTGSIAAIATISSLVRWHITENFGRINENQADGSSHNSLDFRTLNATLARVNNNLINIGNRLNQEVFGEDKRTESLRELQKYQWSEDGLSPHPRNSDGNAFEEKSKRQSSDKALVLQGLKVSLTEFTELKISMPPSQRNSLMGAQFPDHRRNMTISNSREIEALLKKIQSNPDTSN